MENITSSPTPLRLNLTQVRDLLVRFIRDEAGNAGFTKGVVGVSGGVDSAVSAALAAEALGKENVTGVLMPYRTSSPASAKDGAALLGRLGVKSETVDITPIVDGFLAMDDGMDRVRKGNLMARARMMVLYDISARDRAIVVGTSNKTEILLGYGTLHGDTACGINPIGDLYKTQIWDLAAELKVPEEILRKKPSADLWEGQTDEEELGFSYKQVDLLLYAMVDERRDERELEEMGFERNFIGIVSERIRRNQFKRRPPLIAKVSGRTVNVDFRYPRDWGI